MVMRLQDQDFTYWFLSEAFGWDVVLQLVWTFSEPLPDNDVEAMAVALAGGPLHRRIVRPLVPGARPGWVRSAASAAPVVDTEPVDDDEVQAWATLDLETVDLDADAGTCWALRSVRTRAGGSALSLTCLHLVADGRSMTAAAASAGAAVGRVDPPTTGPAGHALHASATVPRIVSDVVDAARQLVGAGGALARTALSVVGGLRVGTNTGQSNTGQSNTGQSNTGKLERGVPRTARSPAHVRAPRARPSWATVTVDVHDWERIAREHGGTRNSLFVAVIAGALFATGYGNDGAGVKVGIPMSLRHSEEDDRSNATGGVSIVLTERPEPGGDLSDVRRLCRDAFAALSAGRRSATVHLQPVLQLLPLSLVTAVVMSGESSMPDVVASNLGQFEHVSNIGSVTASKVAFRGTAHHVDPAGTRRFGEGLQSWYLETDGKATFAVAGFDESRVGSAQELATALSSELTGWGVPHELW
ncbi:MAG: hypothetical protein WA931_05870 [Rhodococcus sp. (in: high G+C Gram-positive bacteria)]